PGAIFAEKGYMGSSIAPLASDRIHHDGQIVALVVGDTIEAAREGVARIFIDYAEEPPSASFGSPGTTAGLAKPKPPGNEQASENPKVGDAQSAFAAAPVRIDQR